VGFFFVHENQGFSGCQKAKLFVQKRKPQAKENQKESRENSNPGPGAINNLCLRSRSS